MWKRENAHRTGRRDTGKPRPVIAKFLRRPESFEVLRKRYSFKEAEVRIYEDLIPKDLDSRRKLADVVKDARLKGKRTMFVRGDFEGKKYISPNT